jgi:hypothetical protein
MISLFAADSGPVVHVAPLPVFTVGGVTITNSMLYGLVTSKSRSNHAED